VTVYRHANGGMYWRINESGTGIGPGDRVFWVPDDAPCPRGGEVVLYVPEGGRMPDDLREKGFTCYATPLTRWQRRFVDASMTFAEALDDARRAFMEGWTPGPCDEPGCVRERCAPFSCCWPCIEEAIR